MESTISAGNIISSLIDKNTKLLNVMYRGELKCGMQNDHRNWPNIFSSSNGGIAPASLAAMILLEGAIRSCHALSCG